MSAYRHILLIIDEAEERQREVRRGIYAAARPLLPWGFHCLSPSQVADSSRALQQSDGWIGFPDPGHAARAPESYRAIPHLCLDPGVALSPRVPEVDFSAAGREAADYFRNKGYKNFALVSRHRSKRRAALRAGIREEVDADHVRLYPWDKPFQTPAVPEGVRPDFNLDLYAFLSELPDPCAVITEDAERGLEVIEICRRTGIAVPGRFAVLSVEDGSRAEMAFPPCSAFQLPWRQLGRRAAGMLEELFLSGTIGEMAANPGPVKVIERPSTDMLAVSDPVIRNALQLIREEACAGLTVNELLQNVHRPRRWVERHFKALTGSTVLREIHRVRLQKAKELLLETDLTQAAIAEACGFNSLPRFVAAFKKQQQLSPGAFRKELRS